MCGIFGIIEHTPNGRPDRGRLANTARLLAHRGPDNTTIWSDSGVGLIHTRLSLVDLSERSDQPFWDDTRRFALVYNGEVYNYRELRRDLEAEGVRFRTTGDTEVLLELLLRAGAEEAVSRLEGMFAFALYDTFERRLILARDRFGMKPLVMHESAGSFVFASEIQALRPWVKFEPDALSISSYLQGFFGPTQGCTFLRGVRIVPAGSIVRVRADSPSSTFRFASNRDFWDPEEHRRLGGLTPRRLVDELDRLLSASVRSQLMADAPVGVLCSGGVDSSVVVGMAARVHSNVSVFHANVVGRHSETDAAAAVAKHLKLDLKVVEVHDHDFVETLPTIMQHYAHPFLRRPDAVPFFRVSQLVREHGVKGVLSGEAADECFLGYQSMMPKLKALWQWLPQLSPAALRNVARRVLQGSQAVMERREMHRDLASALHNRFEVELESAEIAASDARGRPIIRADDQKTLHALNYHLRTLLHRNDSLGMAASIESRFPFLDRNVVRFAANLPHRYKIRPSPTVCDVRHPFLRDKWILREVARRYVPRSISGRPKRAFPSHAFRRMEISNRFFHDSFVAQFFELTQEQTDFLGMHASRDLKLRLLQLEVWGRVIFCGGRQDEVLAKLRREVIISPDRK